MLRTVALCGIGAFLIVAVVLHVLNPNLTPATHVISEYANARVGWLLAVGLLAWAASLLATAGFVLCCVRGLAARRAVAALLGVAAGGLVLAAAFRTQAVAGAVPPDVVRTTGGRLHDAGAGLATLALFAAAAVVGIAEGASSRLGRASMALVAVAVVVEVSLLLVGHEVGGLRQRLLVGAALGWQAWFVNSSKPLSTH
jgi:hypothetical protein